MKDSEALLYVLNQLDKEHCSLEGLKEDDKVKKAEIMINNSMAMGVPDVVRP